MGIFLNWNLCLSSNDQIENSISLWHESNELAKFEIMLLYVKFNVDLYSFTQMLCDVLVNISFIILSTLKMSWEYKLIF